MRPFARYIEEASELASGSACSSDNCLNGRIQDDQPLVLRLVQLIVPQWAPLYQAARAPFGRIYPSVQTSVDTIIVRQETGTRAMRIAGIRELRANSATLLRGDEPVLVARHGKVSGVYLPLEEPGRLPLDLRRELSAVLGRQFARFLDARGVTEKRVAEDFRAYRKRRR